MKKFNLHKFPYGKIPAGKRIAYWLLVKKLYELSGSIENTALFGQRVGSTKEFKYKGVLGKMVKKYNL